jgi:peptide/nickel transport system substrate-binding protein
MDEQTLRHLTSEVEVGHLSRRRFTQILIGLGLTGPMAAQILGSVGIVHAQPKEPVFTPRQRGGGGALRTLWWQAPTLLNPHFSTGTKDTDASRIFYEPLVSYDPEGNLVPVLAAELPSVANGGVAKDGKSVTWRLKKDVRWHDGKPFSADDVVFTWEFVSDPGTAAVTVGSYREISKIDKIDSHAIKITFARPQPFWADAFCGNRGMILPKHVFENFKGAKSREAPANLKPVGTGAYRITDFRPGDVVKAELNPTYHVPNWPFFDSLEMKGGGDAASAARAVFQTGEYDYAWNLQVEDDILLRMEQGGKGRINIWATGNVEHTMCNFSDP